VRHQGFVREDTQRAEKGSPTDAICRRYCKCSSKNVKTRPHASSVLAWS